MNNSFSKLLFRHVIRFRWFWPAAATATATATAIGRICIIRISRAAGSFLWINFFRWQRSFQLLAINEIKKWICTIFWYTKPSICSVTEKFCTKSNKAPLCLVLSPGCSLCKALQRVYCTLFAAETFLICSEYAKVLLHLPRNLKLSKFCSFYYAFDLVMISCHFLLRVKINKNAVSEIFLSNFLTSLASLL